MNIDWFFWHLIGIEAASVGTSFWMYYLLGLKDRRAWMLYVASGLTLVYLMAVKESWVTVANQTLMAFFGFKNYYAFERLDRQQWHKLDWLSLPVFFGSLFLAKDASWSSLSEIFLWAIIIVKTVLLGKGQAAGWKWQIAQQTASIFFGLHRGIYLYVGKSIIQLVQAFWGYWLWKKP